VEASHQEGEQAAALGFVGKLELPASAHDAGVLAEDTGTVRGRWKLQFSNESESGGLFTLLMRRFDEGWRIVHDHTSAEEG